MRCVVRHVLVSSSLVFVGASGPKPLCGPSCGDSYAQSSARLLLAHACNGAVVLFVLVYLVLAATSASEYEKKASNPMLTGLMYAD